MANNDSKISSLTALTTADASDELLVIDKSDTTDGVGGTGKKITSQNFKSGLATTIELSAHITNTSNPHSVTKTQVGLANVDNTADTDKPVSTATQSALDGKSATNHTHTGVYEPADANIQSHISSTSNPHSVTASQVGAVPTSRTINSKALSSDISLTASDVGAKATGADETANVTAASDTTAGKVELATTAETTTGSDTDRAITPDGLAGSSIFGVKTVQLTCFDYATEVATGDGKGYIVIPASLNGMNLVSVHAKVITAGTTNTTDVQIANVTDSVDMLSTKLTIDSGETGSDTAATAAVIDTTKDDVATNDLLRIDVDATATTKAKGLIITLGFQLP